MNRKEEIEKAAMQVVGVHPVWSNLDCFRITTKYVHQLQNAYYLVTGKDLEIKI